MSQLIKGNIFFYLVFLLPLSFIFGVAITEIISFILIVYYILLNKKFLELRLKIVIFLFFISFYIALNAAIQIDGELQISSIFHFRYAILSISIFYLINLHETKNEKKEIKILSFFLFFLWFLFFDSLYQFTTGENIFGNKIISNRISSIFGNELILGSFLLKILPMILWALFFFQIDLKKNNKYLTFFFSLYLITVYLAAGRTSFLLTLLFIFLIFLLVKNIRKILRSSLIFFLLFAILISIFKFGDSRPANRIFIKTFHQITNQIFTKNNNNLNIEKKIDINKIYNNAKIFSSDHNGHYILAFELFKNSPVFGVGPKGFRYFCRSVNYNPRVGTCSTHPHNIFIQILAETGLFGLIFYLISISFLIFNILKHASNKKNILDKDKNCLFIASLAIIINLFPFLPSGNFFNNWISIINYYYIGLFLYSYKKID